MLLLRILNDGYFFLSSVGGLQKVATFASEK